MIRKYHNNTLQNNPRHRRTASGKQLNQSNQLSFPRQDDCITRKDNRLFVCMHYIHVQVIFLIAGIWHFKMQAKCDAHDFIFMMHWNLYFIRSKILSLKYMYPIHPLRALCHWWRNSSNFFMMTCNIRMLMQLKFRHILFNKYKWYTTYVHCKHIKDKNESINAYRVLFRCDFEEVPQVV